MPAIGEDHPAASLHFVLEPLGGAFVVPGIVEQFAATVTPGSDVIVRAGELNSWGSWHPGKPG